MAKKKIIFTGGGTVGHVTLNLLLIPRFLKDGWEVHYICLLYTSDAADE